MKKIIIILFFILFHNSSISQSGKVFYKINIETPNIDVPIQIREKVKDINEAAKNQKFELSFNKNISNFKFIKDLKTEYKFEKVARSGLTSSYELFYDKINNFEIRKMLDGTLIKYEKPIKSWIITKESKKIEQYICYKALLEEEKTNRSGKKIKKTITAWFAPTLPHSYGPKNYYGLPGLILELTENKTTFLAQKITLQKKENKIEKPKGKTITQEEFDLKQEEMLEMNGIDVKKTIQKEK